MTKTYILDFIKNNKVFSSIILLTFLSALRTFIIPPQGDEITYLKIGNNIINGQYYLNEYPSTVTPIIPFLVAFFNIPTTGLGFALLKCFHILLTIIGFRYLFLVLKRVLIPEIIIFSIIALTIANSNSVAWFTTIYPEAILFFSFWGFLYYATHEMTLTNVKKMLFFLLLLVLTRYVYAILGVLVFFYFYKFITSKSIHTLDKRKLFLYAVLAALPLIFWFKYVYNIEKNNLSEISYFTRFKSDHSFLNNIKYGLGISQSPEVSRINGIPAFISLFVPITGFRNSIGSIFLIIVFLFGYFKTPKSFSITVIFGATILIMVGLIFAGTGFSRYWIVLLPSILLGYYFVSKHLNINEKWVVWCAQLIAFIYILNEFRLDYIILNKYL